MRLSLKEMVFGLLPVLEADDGTFAATGPDHWRELRRGALHALREGGAAPTDVDAFWRFTVRLAGLRSKLRNQQILEVASYAAMDEAWARRFWLAPGGLLPVWELAAPSKPHALQAAEVLAYRLLQASPSPEVGEAWLQAAPEAFRTAARNSRETAEAEGDRVAPRATYLSVQSGRLSVSSQAAAGAGRALGAAAPGLGRGQASLRSPDASPWSSASRFSLSPRASQKGVEVLDVVPSSPRSAAAPWSAGARRWLPGPALRAWGWLYGPPRLTTGPSDADPDPVADPVLLCALPQKVLLALVVCWATTPALLVLSLFNSTCEAGLQIHWYAIPFLSIAFGTSIEVTALRSLGEATSFLAEQHAFSRGKWVPNMFDRVLRICYPEWGLHSAVLDHWYFLMAMGVMSTLDLATDTIQVGQVRQCELDDGSFGDRYARSWSEMGLRDFASSVELSGFFAMLLAGIFLVQGVIGSVKAWQALRLVRPEGLAAGNFPDIGVRAERVRRKLRGKVDLMKKLARVAEAASMFFASRVLVELASEVEGFIAATSERKTTGSPTAGQVYGAPADGAGSPSKADGSGGGAPRGLKQARDRQRLAADQRRFKFCFWSVVRLVLLESVPSLSLTVAFFSLQFHRLGPLGQAKTVLSTCCSAASALSMGLYAYSGGLKGKIVAALVVLFVLLPLVKMVFAFVCDSNFFSAMTFRCVEPVETEA